MHLKVFLWSWLSFSTTWISTITWRSMGIGQVHVQAAKRDLVYSGNSVGDNPVGMTRNDVVVRLEFHDRRFLPSGGGHALFWGPGLWRLLHLHVQAPGSLREKQGSLHPPHVPG